jgi:hypothetical protein
MSRSNTSESASSNVSVELKEKVPRWTFAHTSTRTTLPYYALILIRPEKLDQWVTTTPNYC